MIPSTNTLEDLKTTKTLRNIRKHPYKAGKAEARINHAFSGHLAPTCLELASDWAGIGIILTQQDNYSVCSVPESKTDSFTLAFIKDRLSEYGARLRYLGTIPNLFIMPLEA